MSKVVLIMAGGTGGHIYPAAAVAEALTVEGYQVVWLGSEYGMEGDIVPQLGFTFASLPVTAWHGKAIRKITAPINMFRALIKCFGIFRQYQPCVAIGFGGYPSAPGGLVSVITKTPLVLHEQNGVPGLTNRRLAKFATLLLEAFPNTFEKTQPTTWVGNPVRAAIRELGLPSERKSRDESTALRILVLGGSQGAQVLNDMVPAATNLANVPLEIRHQVGRGNVEPVQQKYASGSHAVEVDEFIDNMAEAYQWADLVIARSGASTVSELAAAGVPSLLVPYPWHRDKQQYRNAEWLSAQGVAEVFEQSTLTAAALSTRIVYWAQHRDELLATANKAWHLGVRDGSQKIVGLINTLLEEKNHD